MLWERITPLVICKKGNAIIKVRWGYPIKWRAKPRCYFKIPFIDTFDTVDVRKKYRQLNAHSFHASVMEKSLIPYNISIDVQVEYQVINPLIIYESSGYLIGEDVYESYVNNVVQEEISTIICEKGINTTYENVKNHIKQAIQKNTRIVLSLEQSKTDDDSVRKKSREKKNPIKDPAECISISNIVITSFDKTISVRNTI